jgi:integrase
MGRETKKRANGTGSVCEFTDERGRKRFKVGIAFYEKGRIKQTWKRLEPGTKRDRAEQIAAGRAERAAADPQVDRTELPAGELWDDWIERWLEDRASRKIQTKVDRGRLKVHVVPRLKGKPMASIVRADIEDIVESLDRKVLAGKIKWKTARNVWGVISKSFDDAAHAKTRLLRVREDNPAADVRGPDRGAKTLKQYLYPDEFSRFIRCQDVPLQWRRFVALAVYLYVRMGELEALEWEDVDLERGIIHIHRAIDHEEDGSIKATKTDTPRKFPIEPALLPLLRLMYEESDGEGRVITLPSETNHARGLRTYLMRAGVTRAELHAKGDKSRKQITAYDLRATGITWRAVRGDDPLKVMAAAGHKIFSTTQGYIREAEPIREGFGAVFPSIDSMLVTPELLRGAKYAQKQVPKEGLETAPAWRFAG